MTGVGNCTFGQHITFTFTDLKIRVLDSGDRLEPSFEKVHDRVLADDGRMICKTELSIVGEERTEEIVILGIDAIEENRKIRVCHMARNPW